MNSLYQDAQSAVKWQGEISEKFRVGQGVLQGGILSTDLYKVYTDSLLDRLTLARNATRIEPTICVASSCADDCAVGADSPDVLQSLLDIALATARWRGTSYNQLKVLSLRFSTNSEDQFPIIVMVGIWTGSRCLQLTRRCMLGSAYWRTQMNAQ